MRISDWSSDVCSSDLIYPDLVLNVFYQWADSSLQTGYLYHNASGMDYAIHSIQILFSGFVVQNARSEEHTSELQSLMRISYAVLCLKQNISNIIRTHQLHHNSKSP